jgi:thymidylate synthase
MKEYMRIVESVLSNGRISKQRARDKDGNTLEVTRSTGEMFKHNMADGFPLMTRKFVSLKNVCVELEFFIKGITDKSWLQDRGCHIWDDWCSPGRVPAGDDLDTRQKMKEERELGPVYGHQWRNFNGSEHTYVEDGTVNVDKTYGIDQLQNVIDTLRVNPTDRRMIVMAWNPLQLLDMALPPCHFGFQLLSDGKYLDLIWYQRSVDTFIGLPYNIASYAMLLKLIARTVGLQEGNLIGQLGDVHIYENHMSQINELREREEYQLPDVSVNSNDIFGWTCDDFRFDSEYRHSGSLAGEIAV